MNRVSSVLVLMTACSLPVGMAYADAAAGKPTLDLRAPELRDVSAAAEVTSPSDSQEPEDIAITGGPKDTSNLHISETGIGSLYWAFRHPRGAWKIVLPMSTDDSTTASEGFER